MDELLVTREVLFGLVDATSYVLQVFPMNRKEKFTVAYMCKILLQTFAQYHKFAIDNNREKLLDFIDAMKRGREMLASKFVEFSKGHVVGNRDDFQVCEKDFQKFIQGEEFPSQLSMTLITNFYQLLHNCFK